MIAQDAAASLFDLGGVCKRRSDGNSIFELRVEELVIQAGDRIALTGRSGSGKSTLLDMLAFILSPDSCERFVFRAGLDNALDICRAWGRRGQSLLSRARRRHIGYVLQTGGLLPFLTVAENINLSRRLLGLPDRGGVRVLAEQLGLTRHLAKRPGELSVGERQRVAVARALAHDPSVIIADEPTASLDPMTADTVMALFMEQVERRRITAIVASHEWHRMDALGLTPLKQSITVDDRSHKISAVFSR